MIRDALVKGDRMNESKLLRKEIGKYLMVPFILAIPLLIMNGVVYCLDRNSGIIVSIFIVIYLGAAGYIFFKQRNNMLSISRMDKIFNEYDGLLNIFDKNSVFSLIGIPLSNDDKVESILITYMTFNSACMLRKTITNLSINTAWQNSRD